MFDLSQVLGKAQEVTASSNSNDNFKYRVIYPGTGTLKVKLLFCPKAGIVSRMIRRHKIEDQNHVCLSTYGMDCPICQAIANVKNAIGQDLWRYKSNVRAISIAQYVGSQNYNWSTNPKGEPRVNEIIILMYPWTVYQDINRQISNAGQNAYQLIASNIGKIFNITNYQEGTQVKYKCEIDAFSNHTSCNSDQEFEKLLNDLDDINELVAPKTATNELIKEVTDASEAISREYLKNLTAPSAPMNLGGIMPNQAPPQTQVPPQDVSPQMNFMAPPMTVTSPQINPAMQMNQPQVQYQNPNPQQPIMNQTPIMNQNPAPQIPNQQVMNPAPQMMPNQQVMNPAPQITPQAPTMTSAPACFGQHKAGTQQCLMCANEIQCSAVAGC